MLVVPTAGPSSQDFSTFQEAVSPPAHRCAHAVVLHWEKIHAPITSSLGHLQVDDELKVGLAVNDLCSSVKPLAQALHSACLSFLRQCFALQMAKAASDAAKALGEPGTADDILAQMSMAAASPKSAEPAEAAPEGSQTSALPPAAAPAGMAVAAGGVNSANSTEPKAAAEGAADPLPSPVSPPAPPAPAVVQQEAAAVKSPAAPLPPELSKVTEPEAAAAGSPAEPSGHNADSASAHTTDAAAAVPAAALTARLPVRPAVPSLSGITQPATPAATGTASIAKPEQAVGSLLEVATSPPASKAASSSPFAETSAATSTSPASQSASPEPVTPNGTNVSLSTYRTWTFVLVNCSN